MNKNPQDENQDQKELGAESFFVDPVQQRTQLLYTKQLHERQIFMKDLKEHRRRLEKSAMKTMRKLIGPRWYQVLSVPQRKALDKLEEAIYQDLLEGLPNRTSKIMQTLGIYPPPNPIDLMNCNFYGSSDPKKMLAELFFLSYGHSIQGKRGCYNLNARLMLSAILYLGLKNLIELLRERFKPDQDPTKTPPKPKTKRGPPLPSPYLEKTVIPVWCPASPKKFTPPPLPNLDDLNEPYEGDDEHRIQLKPPPPPPPPPPPKRVPRDLCDKLAGIIRIEPDAQVTALTIKTTTTRSRKRQNSQLTTEIKKKTYGICIERPNKKGSSRRRLRAPTTGLDNIQYLIQGVYKVGGRQVFVIGSVSITPADGDLIHGGFAHCNGTYTNVHLGYRALPAAPPPDPCNCLSKWQNKVFEYVQQSKCYCGHNYDYGHEGTFPKDELPYFQKPVPGAPYQFNYDTIFDIDEKQLFVKKEFKKIWETDSVIGTKKDSVVKKKEKKRTSKTCLGQHPKPQDYLKCALRLMRGVNIAARLPDVHLVPELLEWMRRRLYGPHNADARQEYLRKTNMLQTMLQSITSKGYGRVVPQNNPEFMHCASDWAQAFRLRHNFNKHTDQFKRQLFKSLANVNNLFWRIMFHSEFPDKKFREIFFSYLSATAEELMIMRPYASGVVQERKEQMLKRRYACPPAGVENLDH